MPTAPTFYVRCNHFLSLAVDENGQPCRFMVKASTENEALTQMSQHVQKVHKQNPKDLMNNIKACIHQTGTKTFGTRGVGSGHH
ncbi:MAG: DUF1059 domain-containing protein [SAR202 cluster bacterium]|nr:DUF1059 domain-containing protein [SAR202 cluster bacterium]